jgi:hypothetical protein
MCTEVRAFVIYNHIDHEAAQRLADWIKKRGWLADSYENAYPGTVIKPELLSRMESSQIVIALWPNDPEHRTWVSQEIGYVLALNIPLLTITSNGPPGGLITDINALQVSNGWSNLEERLDNVAWKELIDSPNRDLNRVVATLVRSGLDRVKLLIRYGEDAQRLERRGPLRQSGSFSSMCIPNKPPYDAIWRDYAGTVHPDADYHELKRMERQVLERQARKAGCKLILDVRATHENSIGRRTRLKVLAEFLESPLNDETIQAITRTRLQESSLTIFGESWVSESFLRSHDGYYRDAIFTWHPVIVKHRIAEFDEMFSYLCNQRDIAPERSRERALGDIKDELAERT